MKTYPHNRALIRAWAAQSAPSGKCGNLRFEGATLYSYAVPIARHTPEGTQIITNKHSVTTSRHCTLARVACREYFTVPALA